MIIWFVVGLLWVTVLGMICQVLYLNRFAAETIEHLRTLDQLVLKQTGEQGNGNEERDAED